MKRRMLKYAGLIVVGGFVFQIAGCAPAALQMIYANLGPILIQQGLAAALGVTT